MSEFNVVDRPKIFIEAEDFRTITIGINQNARDEYQKVIEEAKEAGVTNIYDKGLPYWAKLKELEDFMSVTHVVNSIITQYIEIIKLRDELTEGEKNGN